MTLLASILLFALTRAEIIDRFRATPITVCDGLVQVIGDCPADMRREYQTSVAGFAADVCRTLYSARKSKPPRFSEPGIFIHIGDVRTNVTNVVTRTYRRSEGERYTRIYLPAPGFSDTNALRLGIARAFFLAVDKKVVGDAAALAALIVANPELRVAKDRAELADWRERGIYATGQDDEDYLLLQRKILKPGIAEADDILTFASRLFLYPTAYAMPFCGRYESCTFAEAIPLAKRDPSVRFAAFVKSRQIPIFGGGRGPELATAADAYAAFLLELARFEKTETELAAMLAAADMKLKGLIQQ